MARSERHYPALDGLRGVAALMIVVYHFLTVAPIGGALHAYASRALGFTWAGVDLFFVLSGFLITGILADSRSRKHYFRNFYARRILRIFPLYYLVLVVVLVVLPGVGVPTEVPTSYRPFFWTYSTNFFFASFGWIEHRLTHLWSLAIEEQFYLVWPLVVFWASDLEKLRRGLPFAVLTLMALRVVLISNGVPLNTLYLLTVTHCDGLLAGAYLALALKSSKPIPQAVRKPSWFLVLGLCIVSVAFSNSFRWNSVGTAPPAWRLLQATFTYTSLAVLFMMVVYRSISEEGSRLRRFFSNAVLRWFGKYSYALYVLHVPVAVWLLESHGQSLTRAIGRPWLADVVLFTLFAGSSTLLAYLSWHLFEKHFLKLKRYFSSSFVPAVEP